MDNILGNSVNFEDTVDATNMDWPTEWDLAYDLCRTLPVTGCDESYMTINNENEVSILNRTKVTPTQSRKRNFSNTASSVTPLKRRNTTLIMPGDTINETLLNEIVSK
ncbi:unnamed protein product [Didymodactylos carnosus]|uniref:Uncharacterized protein n=1 Tax=Didymodactylos carnosus TaxID=1234261 RepID=A0A813ZF87_9BILA|nr:unnamed protein product [Didymodactylos carnosus]CAF1100229.1 unnamed protein product [Didymodactylos carnosus]CAF3680489.1 unnamed protein product [Didymodactylos carnosus]CAF3861689.1 unnamed protein product [Didymodactylos carnosus]